MARAPDRRGQYRTPPAARPFIAVAFILVMLVAGWLTYRWYNGDIWTAAATETPSVVQVTAGELAAAYDEDAVQAHSLYGDRTLQITGMMWGVSAGMGDPVVMLGGTDPLLRVPATLDEADTARLATLPTNQPLSLTCRRVMLVVDEPALSDCILGGEAGAATD